jgi:regulatory protein
VPTPCDPADLGPPADPEAVARAICLRQLTGAPRTRAQLAEALSRRNVPADVADRVLSRFGEVGLIDDAEFARMWVQSRHLGRGLARRALARELRARGVDDEIAGDVVDALGPDEEMAAARALVERRLPRTRGLDRATRTRRLAAFLARKGYPGSLSLQVVREVLAETTDGTGGDTHAVAPRPVALTNL